MNDKNNKYLHICSTKRDRNLYPNVADFNIKVTNNGTRNKTIAYDPVSLEAPLIRWCPANTSSIAGDVVVNNINSNNVFVGKIPSSVITNNLYSRNNNFNPLHGKIYSSIPIEVYDNNNNEQVEVEYIHFLHKDNNSHYFLIELSEDITPPGATHKFVFNDPTDIINYGMFFVPNNFEKDYLLSSGRYYLWNETKSQGVLINNYYEDNKIISITNTNNWLKSDFYSIRENIPTYSGVTFSNITDNKATLTTNITNITEIVKGDFLNVLDINNISNSEIYRIIDFDRNNNTITTDKNIDTYNNNNNNKFEILSFSYDNANPLNFSGSYSLNKGLNCFEIELIYITLPNVILKNGGKISADYPFVYVTLENENYGVKNITYSNNENSYKSTFIASINDTSKPETSLFLKINGDKMVQTFKFNPSENIKFNVSMPNGEKFETLLSDNMSPLKPNDKLQLSALFRLKKL